MSEPQTLVRDFRSLPFFWISHSVLKKHNVKGRAYMAYSALAYISKGRTHISAPIHVLAEIVGVSEDTMRRGLAECEKRKVIQIKKRFKKTSGKATRQQLSHEYILLDLKDDGDDPL